MTALEIVVGILAILVSIALIGMIILQQSHRRGINGVISGAADNFLSKNQSQTADSVLPKLTKIFAIVFFLLAVAGNVLTLID
ncbi:MAG: preprotein translocase subunit SecG [Clostridiales bacterium]|nr:preprotein translocase subunit SecG [Candidatus Equinaster intestinalis]